MEKELFYTIRIGGKYVTEYDYPLDYELGTRREATWLTRHDIYDWLDCYQNSTIDKFDDGGFTIICMGDAFRKVSD